VIDNTDSRCSKKTRTLIFSLRNIFPRDLFRGAHYEFEDMICQIEHAQMVAPRADIGTRRNAIAKTLAFRVPMVLKPSVEKIEADKSYDLFLAICGHPRDLLYVNAVSHLRNACTTKICMIDELWAKQIEPHAHFLNILKSFDLVVLYCSGTVKALSERIGVKCVFVPPGIDTLAFCPFPKNSPRAVDVSNVGRRSPITHSALLEMVKERDIFYVYDSIDGTESLNLREHRKLLANLVRRSRYYIVNPGAMDNPRVRGDQHEMGPRYIEGAAAGAILIGESPANEVFNKILNWPGAVVHLPYGSDQIASVIDELDRQPEWQEEIRRRNVSECLMKHDWAHRWETMLTAVGRDPVPELTKRKTYLLSMADALRSSELAI
jgi:hypothetical protein